MTDRILKTTGICLKIYITRYRVLFVRSTGIGMSFTAFESLFVAVCISQISARQLYGKTTDEMIPTPCSLAQLAADLGTCAIQCESTQRCSMFSVNDNTCTLGLCLVKGEVCFPIGSTFIFSSFSISTSQLWCSSVSLRI